MSRHVLLFGFVLILTILVVQHVLAGWVLVQNGSFESGTVGLVPDDWVMVTLNWTDPPDAPKDATFIHEMEQTDQKYFEGGRSLWLHSRVVDEGLRIGRGSITIAETEDWINTPTATHVRIYMRDIKSTHSLGWGWGNSIFLSVNNVSVARTDCYGYWGWIFTQGEFCNYNHYNYTAVGVDGESWYVYEYSIPESVDKTHMKIQIACWAWDWTFYSTSYFSDLQFVVDKVELLLAPPNEPPVACFDVSNESPNVCESVTFDASCSYDPDGTIVKYEWDWDGDSTYDFDAGSNPIATHHYDMHGTYSPKLRLTDSDGLTNETSIAILVRGHPVADFIWTPTSPQVCETVTFDASASTPDGGVVVSWDWDFGDTTTGSGEIVTHHYDAPGDYEVTLTVTDDEGKSGTVTKTIHVRALFGGITNPVDKFGLLAPYIGAASTILIATAAIAIYAKRVKHRKEKQ